MPFKLSNFEIHKGSADGPVLEDFEMVKTAKSSTEIEKIVIKLHNWALKKYKFKIQVTYHTKWENYRNSKII